MDYATPPTTLDPMDTTTTALGLALLFYLVIFLLIIIFQKITMWKVFTKSGEKGWKALIPIYNFYTFFKICGLSPWPWLLLSSLMIYFLMYANTYTTKTSIISVFIIYIIFMIIINVILIVSIWKIFEKAGEKGWKSLIPIYNICIFLKICNISPWLIFLYLTCIIPIIGIPIIIAFNIYIQYKLGKVFNKSGWFVSCMILYNPLCILFAFFHPILYFILAFGNSEYIGSNSQENA